MARSLAIGFGVYGVYSLHKHFQLSFTRFFLFDLRAPGPSGQADGAEGRLGFRVFGFSTKPQRHL